MNRDYVSTATINNWERLGVDEEHIEKRLSKRANKRFSAKKIVPTEYLSSAIEPALFSELLDKIKEFNCSNETVIYNLALSLLLEHGLISISDNEISSNNPYILEILKNYPDKSINKNILKFDKISRTFKNEHFKQSVIQIYIFKLFCFMQSRNGGCV